MRVLVVVTLFFSVPAFGGKFSETWNGNKTISSFDKAKDLLVNLYRKYSKTFYCDCSYAKKKIFIKSCGVKSKKHENRLTQLEWEHIVPASFFGETFDEWVQGDPECIRDVDGKHEEYKGRECAKHNKKFRLLESDLYNLVPAVGAINAHKSNKIFKNIYSSDSSFGKCDFKVNDTGFSPKKSLKGDVARIYLYMEWAYPQRSYLTKTQRSLAHKWDRLDPVSDLECKIYYAKKQIQKSPNRIMQERCEWLEGQKSTKSDL